MEAQTAYNTPQNAAEEGFTSSYFSRSDDKRKELTYRVEQEIARELQPPLKDISYGFAEGLTDMMYRCSDEETFPTRRQAIEYFDRTFMQRELKRVKGNITQYVRDAFGAEDGPQINNLRRNVYRKIGRYGLEESVDAARPWKPTMLDDKVDEKYSLGADKVESTLSTVLSGYKSVIQPELHDRISYDIKEKAPLLAERLSEYMPTPANRIKQAIKLTEGMTKYDDARETFERQVIYNALEAAGFDKKKAAGYLGDSLRTLNRRIESLGLEEQLNEKEQKQGDGSVVHIDDFVRKKNGDKEEKPTSAVNEIERFHQLVREYNDKREAERQRKGKREEKKEKMQSRVESLAA